VYADLGHLSIVGEPIEMALNIVSEYLYAVACKDLMRQRVLRDDQVTWQTHMVRLGHGYGDFPALLRTLKRVNFAGPTSFHSGEPVETVIDVRFAKALLSHGCPGAG